MKAWSLEFPSHDAVTAAPLGATSAPDFTWSDLARLESERAPSWLSVTNNPGIATIQRFQPSTAFCEVVESRKLTWARAEKASRARQYIPGELRKSEWADEATPPESRSRTISSCVLWRLLLRGAGVQEEEEEEGSKSSSKNSKQAIPLGRWVGWFYLQRTTISREPIRRRFRSHFRTQKKKWPHWYWDLMQRTPTMMGLIFTHEWADADATIDRLFS